MSPTKQTAYRIPDDLLEVMQAVKDRDGILLAEQVRRALRAWLEARGELAPTPQTKAARKRVAPRKRA
ncbi:hypothetical protein [Luteitalea sp.]